MSYWFINRATSQIQLIHRCCTECGKLNSTWLKNTDQLTVHRTCILCTLWHTVQNVLKSTNLHMVTVHVCSPHYGVINIKFQSLHYTTNVHRVTTYIKCILYTMWNTLQELLKWRVQNKFTQASYFLTVLEY
jgi:hypothetical protein